PGVPDVETERLVIRHGGRAAGDVRLDAGEAVAEVLRTDGAGRVVGVEDRERGPRASRIWHGPSLLAEAAAETAVEPCALGAVYAALEAAAESRVEPARERRRFWVGQPPRPPPHGEITRAEARRLRHDVVREVLHGAWCRVDRDVLRPVPRGPL